MRKRHEQRLDAEMRARVHLATQDYITAGLSPDEARRRALIDFGAVELAKDEVRDLRPLRWVDEATRDVSYTVRQLRHSPAFTLAIALTLAVAMAANSALFSAVRAVVLKPLPYHDANRLLCIWHGGEENYSWYTFSHPPREAAAEHATAADSQRRRDRESGRTSRPLPFL